MSFMYLELSVDPEDHGGIRAAVKKYGKLNRSVGSENSRMTHGPFAVFAIDGFDGLENIDTEELLRELTDRLSAERIIELMGVQLPKEVLLREVERRIMR